MLTKKISYLFIILFSALIFIAWADSWENLKKSSSTINSISSNFIQKKHLEILKNPLISKGTLMFQRPKFLRWEYSSPIKSILLMSNSNIKRYIKHGNKYELDSSVNMQAMQIVIQEISKWLKGDFNKNPDFNSRLVPGKNRKIVMTPKEEGLSKIIKRIELFLSNKPGMIKKVIIYENKNNYTELLFNNIQLNKQIDQKIFREI